MTSNDSDVVGEEQRQQHAPREGIESHLPDVPHPGSASLTRQSLLEITSEPHDTRHAPKPSFELHPERSFDWTVSRS